MINCYISASLKLQKVGLIIERENQLQNKILEINTEERLSRAELELLSLEYFLRGVQSDGDPINVIIKTNYLESIFEKIDNKWRVNPKKYVKQISLVRYLFNKTKDITICTTKHPRIEEVKELFNGMGKDFN